MEFCWFIRKWIIKIVDRINCSYKSVFTCLFITGEKEKQGQREGVIVIFIDGKGWYCVGKCAFLSRMCPPPILTSYADLRRCSIVSEKKEEEKTFWA